MSNLLYEVNIFKKNMAEENLDGTINYFIEEINKSNLISKRLKKVFGVLNYIEHLLILASAVTEFVSISGFASLFDIPKDISNSVVGLKMCAITRERKSVSH